MFWNAIEYIKVRGYQGKLMHSVPSQLIEKGVEYNSQSGPTSLHKV